MQAPRIPHYSEESHDHLCKLCEVFAGRCAYIGICRRSGWPLASKARMRMAMSTKHSTFTPEQPKPEEIHQAPYTIPPSQSTQGGLKQRRVQTPSLQSTKRYFSHNNKGQYPNFDCTSLSFILPIYYTDRFRPHHDPGDENDCIVNDERQRPGV